MDKNYERAAECFQIAATHGHAAAQVNLGYCYYHGYGVPKNVKHAQTLFKSALDQGHPGADSLVKQLEEEHSAAATGAPPQTPTKGAAPPSPSPRAKPVRYSSSTGEVEETPQGGKAGGGAFGNSDGEAEEDEEAVAFSCCMSPRKPTSN